MLVAHAAATWFMVGLIWFVQTVHYPLFGLVGSSDFPAYHEQHTQRISRLLALPAFAEVVTGAGLLWLRPDAVPVQPVLIGGVLVAAIWVITAVVQVRQHKQLTTGGSSGIAVLVAANWWRTGMWTARGLIVAWMVAQ